MKKKILVKFENTFVKVPMDYITLDVPNEEGEGQESTRGVLLHGNISELHIRPNENANILQAIVPNLSFDIRFPRTVRNIGNGYNDEAQNAFSEVLRTYKRKHSSLKVRSRLGIEMKVKYNKDNMSLHRDAIHMRVAGTGKAVLFPNVYPDGRICWGDSNQLPNCNKPDYMVNRLVNLFFNAPFNQDLSRKRTKKANCVRYIQHCMVRLANLDGWTAREKEHIETWLQGERRRANRENGQEYDVNAYNIWLMVSIFEDDICEVASHICSETVSF